METLLEKLKEVLKTAEDKINELARRESELRGQERYHEMKQKELYEKIADFDSRIQTQIRIEELLFREQKSEVLLKKLQEDTEDLRTARENFNVWKTGEEKRIVVELNEIAKEWKNIRG